jgi:hypothetical protein
MLGPAVEATLAGKAEAPTTPAQSPSRRTGFDLMHHLEENMGYRDLAKGRDRSHGVN